MKNRNQEFHFNRTRGKSSHTKTSASANMFRILPDIEFE